MASIFLIVDNAATGASPLVRHFRSRLSWDCVSVPTVVQGISFCRSHSVAVVLSDMHTAQGSGLDLLATMQRARRRTPVFLMHEHPDVTGVVEAMRLGASYFFEKPLMVEQVVDVIQSTMRGGGESDDFRDTDPDEGNPESFGIITNNVKIRQLVALAGRAARQDMCVLITGETGTGKELFGQLLHQASLRKNGPYVTLNAAGLQEQMLESELFGHARGAFTGAYRDNIGLVESAEGVTLLIDEIGDMAPTVQSKLLRFLENREYRRVGDTRVRHADVRVIAATNRDLTGAMKTGGFRSDLYYRLSGLTLALPPLRDRPEDIVLLANAFYLRSHRRPLPPPLRFTSEVISRLQHYHWPGNVRELQNVMQRAMLLAEDGVIEAHHLQLDQPDEATAWQTAPAAMYDGSYQQARDLFSRAYLTQALEYANGNITRAARRCGVARQTLHQLIHRYHVQLRGAGGGDARGLYYKTI